jgi:1-phosphofructokinase
VFDAVTVTLNPAIDRTLTIPDFTAGRVHRVRGEQSRAGGKGVNVAAALAAAGHRVAATGFLGRDNAAIFEELFGARGIADQFVRLDGPTRTGIKIHDPARQETTDLNFPGLAPTAEELDQLRARLATLDARWFVLAGSLPPGVDAGIYRELIVTLRNRGARVLLDTSGPALAAGLEAEPQVAKPNLAELEELSGRALADEAAVMDAGREWLRRGVELLVISRGESGALFLGPQGGVRAVPPRIKIGSAVGAGDALVAGIISAQLEGRPLAECARIATAFALHALGPADPRRSWREAVDALRPQIVVEELPDAAR